MRVAKTLTMSIQQALRPVIEERAYFFKRLYDEVSDGPLAKEIYLDVDAARATNARVFRQGFQEIWYLDINFTEQQERESKIQFMVDDAQMLPLKERVVDLLSLFSTIEHLPAPDQALREATRLLQRNGEFVIQVPNLFFPIDLHTGILNPFWIPKFYRKTYLRMMGYGDWLNNMTFHGRKTLPSN